MSLPQSSCWSAMPFLHHFVLFRCSWFSQGIPQQPSGSSPLHSWGHVGVWGWLITYYPSLPLEASKLLRHRQRRPGAGDKNVRSIAHQVRLENTARRGSQLALKTSHTDLPGLPTWNCSPTLCKSKFGPRKLLENTESLSLKEASQKVRQEGTVLHVV